MSSPSLYSYIPDSDLFRILTTPDNPDLLVLNLNMHELRKIQRAIGDILLGMDHVHIDDANGVEVLRINVFNPNKKGADGESTRGLY